MSESGSDSDDVMKVKKVNVPKSKKSNKKPDSIILDPPAIVQELSEVIEPEVSTHDSNVLLDVPLRSASRNTSRSASPVSTTAVDFIIATQMSRLNMLSSFNEVAQGSGTPDMTLGELNGHLKLLTDEWQRFTQEHQTLGSSTRRSIFAHPYMTERVYEQAFDLYRKAHHHHLAHLLNQLWTPTHNEMLMPCTTQLNQCSSVYSRPAVLLGTGLALLVTKLSSTQIRFLVDPGSELSFISETVVRNYQLTKQRSSIPICEIGGTHSNYTKGVTAIKLKSLHSSDTVTFNAHVLTQLTTHLPSVSDNTHFWPHIRSLPLADPHYMVARAIDVIIGADYYGLIIKNDLIKDSPDSPIAQLTIFGWILLGPINQCSSAAQHSYHATANDTNHDLNQLLVTFWEQEEVPTSTISQLNPEEQECEDHFVSTHTRDSSGRYVVRLPLNSSPSLLGNSYRVAKICLNRLSTRLIKNPNYHQLYSSFLSEYEQLNHMTRVKHGSPKSLGVERTVKDVVGSEMTLAHDTSVSGGLRVSSEDTSQQILSHPTYYLPHHGVLKEDNSTTKLRVVFNGSSPTTSGKSLNDIQHTGAKLQRDLSDVLIWLRQFKYIFASDITKMYRQINVHSDDWDLQRILWKDEHQDVVSYQLTTVTYGTRSAPFLAIRALLQLVNDEGHRFPRAIPSLIKGRYVDDIYGGANLLKELISTAQDVKELCMAGGFPLAKWQSNHPQFINQFSPDSTKSDSILIDDNSVKILGLYWHPQAGVFKFEPLPPNSGSKSTKRSILSEIAQLFDPLGLLSPFTVKPKMLMQELWLEKINWDEQVPSHLATKWTQLKEDLLNVSSISIPRWYHFNHSSKIELHGFSDASQLAMAAVVYFKIIDPNHRSHISIVCARTKVAPLKRLTIPRLELTAALILSKLVRYVQSTMDLTHVPITLWTDSSVALTWINSHPSRWKEFVRNRVSAIQDLVPNSVWKFVPGKENPADCASRGLNISQLETHHLWWTGPPWLINQPNSWPAFQYAVDSSAQSEEQPGISLNVTTTQPQYHWEMIYRYSSLTRLLRVTSICFRVWRMIKRLSQSTLYYPLTPQDLNQSRLFWIQSTQSAYYQHELKLLSSSSSLPPAHPFNRLTAFIDAQGIIRVGGRLMNAQLDPETTHPAILPRHSHFTKLIIQDAHDATLHGGTQLTLTHIRRSYWVIGGRHPVRSLILRCIKCARHRGKRAQQLMGQLPSSRVIPSRPFSISGVDYAGPLTIKTWRGRGAKHMKGWLCIFVCFTTSAVHLEVVSDYTAVTFIAAFKRFTGRRGICHTLHSDRGTNFEEADNKLKQMFSQGTQECNHLFNSFTNSGTNWRFNPPAAPHMGGKWEAAVKSVKHHLSRTIGDIVLTFEELNTLLMQIEAVLNSRPLEPLSNDPDDVSALTPAHFLIGDTLNTIPEPSLEFIAQPRLNRWQLVQQRMQFFWKKWSHQYLQTQLARSKWHHPSNTIQLGSLVLITDERAPPSTWPLARVIATHPGQDGLIRVVTLKTATTTLKRPIAKLAILPMSADSS